MYYCHRCGAKGRLGHDTTFQERLSQLAKLPQKPKLSWQEVVAKSGVIPIEGTAGQKYLRERGICLVTSQQCSVRFAGSMYGRACVLFDIRDQSGEVVAVQGRYIDKASPRMRSFGPKSHGVFQTPGVWRGDFAITEAPIDAMSLMELGYPAIATCGSGLPDWIAPLCKGRTIWIATDNDEPQLIAGRWVKPGEKYFEEWGAVLKAAGANVKRLRPPNSKDWNEELRKLSGNRFQMKGGS